MPLFSEHISNMYYSGTPSYHSAPSYSYSAPLGMSYSASYLNPGSHYSKHSSLGSYSRPPITPRWTPSTGRPYNPMLTTISERSTSSPVRIGSPRRIHVPKRTYALPTYTPRPIHINTADIDVSRDRYRPSSTSTPSPLAATSPPSTLPPSTSDPPLQNDVAPTDTIDTPIADNGPFMPRVDGKPETGIDSSPGLHQRSTIKRGRTVVRLHTVKRKERDSPRKPVDTAVDDNQTVLCNDGAELQQEPETSQSWREKLSEDLVYKGKKEKKTIGARLVEKFILKDKDDDEDLDCVKKNSLKKIEDDTIDVVDTLPPPAVNAPAPSKSPDRRCSMELLAEQANLLDSLIRSENLSIAQLDLTKVGIEEGATSTQTQNQSSIKRRKSSSDGNPLQTTKSDHSIHDRMKSLRDSRDKHFSKKRSLKKSASGGSLRRLDSITEFPRELPQMNLPAIEESRQSIKNDSVKKKPEPEPTVEEISKPSDVNLNNEVVKDEAKLISESLNLKSVPENNEVQLKVEDCDESKTKSIKQEVMTEKPKLKTKITSSVDVSPPKSPIKFVVDNVTVEEKLVTPKKGFSYSSNIEDEPKKKIQKQESLPKASKTSEDSRLKPITSETDLEAPSPEPDDGNFWNKIGKRETVYLMKRKQNIEENLAKNRRAMFWFPEDEEEQQDILTDAPSDNIVSDSKISTQDEIKDSSDKIPVPNAKIQNEINNEKHNIKLVAENNLVTDIKPIELIEIRLKDELKVDSKIETNDKDVGIAENQVIFTPGTAMTESKNIAPTVPQVLESGSENTNPPTSTSKPDTTPPANTDSPNISPHKTNESINLDKNISQNEIDIKSKVNKGEPHKSEPEYIASEIKASSSEKKKEQSFEKKKEQSSEKKPEPVSKPPVKQISEEKPLKKSPETSLNKKKETIKKENEIQPSFNLPKIEEDKPKTEVPNVSKPRTSKPEVKPKSKNVKDKVVKKKEVTPPGTCTECKKPLPKSSPPKQATALKQENRDVVRRATASIKTANLEVRRYNDEKPKVTAEVPSEVPIVVQPEKEDIPNTQNDLNKEPVAATVEAPAGEGIKAEIVPPTDTGNALIEDKPAAKLTPVKKPVKQEAAVRPLIATPRPLQKKAPQIIHSSSSSESSSEEESSDEEESESSEGSGEFFECENNPDGRTSTGSNDSGFDSSAPTSPAGFVHIKKGGETPGPSASSAPSSSVTVPEVLLDELESSTAYTLFRKTGRFTPPARSIPRFRKYNIEDFHFIKVLGKGSFGKVLLTELRDTEYYYAVKCLKKDVVLEDDDVECTLIERKVLALGTNHPYLCHLFATFQTDSHLFFVMEYLNGGDLMFHIQQSGRFPESRARFYAAEIVSGLKFLHKRGIVYRDLKLDNILLDYEGHVRIADFGMCKLQIFLDKTADTFCGTPDYMAPEIIKGLKYNQTVDWWSFGVLLYEMLIGQSPFSGCDEDELFWSICNEMPSYPRFLSQEALTILTRLLDKDARTRMGGIDCMHGDVRDQEFFHSIHWERLERRELETPFKPRVRHPLDTQYFDRAFTGERPRLTAVEPQVLRSMDQEPFRGFSYTNPNATDR